MIHDFRKINFIVSKSLFNRLNRKTKLVVKGKIKKPEKEPVYSKAYQKLYGKYKGNPTIVARIPIFPIYGCSFKIPLSFSQETNKYTPQGRQLIHRKLNSATQLVCYLLNNKEYDKSVEYNDNRISLMAGQHGKCYVTGEQLSIENMECHHKKPKELGGSDKYNNLVWLRADVHKLIHATQPDTIAKYLNELKLGKQAFEKVNSLRLLAEKLEIVVETA